MDYATGAAFSVPKSVTSIPPTLKNIFIELVSDMGIEKPKSGDLSPWIDEGVFLLNSILTCDTGKSLSHSKMGWKNFTKMVLSSLSDSKRVAILWGNNAQGFSHYFDEKLTISSPHPSPLSAYRGFFGSRPFSRTNELLIGAGMSPIDWAL
jgi:uracil-DNA glycosylase